MDSQSPDHLRILQASPSTRRVIRLGSSWMVLCLLAIGIAATLTALAPLGIVVHPPAAYQVLAIVIAAMSAPVGAFFFAYMSRSKTRWGHWMLATFGGALFFGCRLSSLGWAVPVVTTLYASNQQAQVMTLTGTSDLAVSRMGCRHRGYFGSLLRPSGHICMDEINVLANTGLRLTLQGSGNSWATRVTTAAGL